MDLEDLRKKVDNKISRKYLNLLKFVNYFISELFLYDSIYFKAILTINYLLAREVLVIYGIVYSIFYNVYII